METSHVTILGARGSIPASGVGYTAYGGASGTRVIESAEHSVHDAGGEPMKEYLKPYVLKLTFVTNILFLIWHAVLLCVFGYKQLWILAVFNVFSLGVYFRALFALRRHQTQGVIRLMYVELLFHMLISVICMGWNCGFQEYAFGILPIIMFGDYIEDSKRVRYHSIAMTMSVAFCYLGLSIWTSVNPPIYTFSTDEGTKLFSIINGSATMFAVSAYFLIFTRMILGFERGLIHDANYDLLTGLANRRSMYEYRKKLRNADYCVFMIDIDNFKQINDTYGHDAGDLVLETVGELLAKCKLRMENFLPVRWGGEEFVAVYYDEHLGREEKLRHMECIRQQIGAICVRLDDKEIYFTATIGAAASGEEDTIDELIALADSRMYYGKTHGKDCLVFTHDEWRNSDENR